MQKKLCRTALDANPPRPLAYRRVEPELQTPFPPFLREGFTPPLPPLWMLPLTRRTQKSPPWGSKTAPWGAETALGRPKSPKRTPGSFPFFNPGGKSTPKSIKMCENTRVFTLFTISEKTALGAHVCRCPQSAEQEGSARLVRGSLPRGLARSPVRGADLLPPPF